MSKPTVSVIIPACCNENFFKTTINSVLCQTFQNFEIIVINFNSENNLQDAVNSFEDNKICYFHKNNINQNAARNYGLRRAKGKYIALLDAGDIWNSEKLEKQVEILDKKPDIGLVYCGTSLIDEQGKFLQNIPPVSYKGNVFKKLVKYNFLHNASVALFRADCTTDGFDESIKKLADWEFYLKLSLKYKFWGIKKHLVLHRISEQSPEEFESFESSGFKVLNRAFQATDLKTKDLRLINLAYALRYRDMGKKYFENNCFERSKGYFYEALKRDFSVSFRSDALVFYLRAYFSEKNSSFINSLKNC